ncbi:ABC transporter ATP-binding protein [Leifsonia bigeumensis]|uniref:ABC transporter ATP-binding protein n=1 Tax=Leifsonella bigeumensis TaxID=433643 RepID=A0ABP7FDD5_9MICO
MIRFDAVTFRYSEASTPVLDNASLSIPEGELCLVVGATGSGKSTVLRLVNGLAPHFTGGHLTGTVTVDGLDTRTHPPRDLAGTVGVVGQDPLAGFVTERVEDELAYSMEQLGVPAPTMRQRVEEVIDLLGLHRLRHRALTTLSAGEQQRVAIGSALTAGPRVLVLDEPTSALDPHAAEEVLAALLRLVHDLGVTVLLAEHRLERVIQYADSVLRLDTEGALEYGTPAVVLASSPIAPPIVELGRLDGWEPLPLSIRDARRVAGPLRERLRSAQSSVPSGAVAPAAGSIALTARGLRVRYGRMTAIDGLDLDLRAGELTALMGRNGSGKSSLLWALQGTGTRSDGTVRVVGRHGMAGGSSAEHGSGLPGGPGAVVGSDPASGVDPATLAPDAAIRHIVLVPHAPADLLYLESVGAECREADRAAGALPGTASATLERLWPGVPEAAHPRDLSEGQRLALVLALQLAGAPGVVLLDEPTRGLDYEAKRRLGALLAEVTASGGAVLLSSHDVEFVAGTADRVVVLSDGEIITDGPVSDVLTASPGFAPQVARILRPLPFLTVDGVRRAIAGTL